jgi:hypothetical protein
VDGAVSTHLRRIIDFGPGSGVYPGSPNDYRFHDNRAHVVATNTPWIRLWADWPSMQPMRNVAIDDPANPGAPWLQAVDEQIAAACADGVRVLLCAYRFPAWANDTEALVAARNTDAEVSFGFADRISGAAWRRYVRNGRDPSRFNPSRRGLDFRVPPAGVGPDSDWSRFFAFLYARYHAGLADTGRCVYGFELVNEPNFQLWPQRAPSETSDPFAATSPLIVQHTVAQLMATAQAVADRFGDTTLLLAPSTADSEIRGRTVTGFDEFAAALLDALDAIGHRPGPMQGYAHHNYTDLERRWDQTYVQQLRAVLGDRWTGFAEGTPPTVFITEGGVRLGKMRDYYPTEDPLEAQARSMREGWDRHVRDDGPGEGVAMLAQYQTYSDPRFDAGLLDPWPSGQRRPIYDVWAGLPRHE